MRPRAKRLDYALQSNTCRKLYFAMRWLVGSLLVVLGPCAGAILIRDDVADSKYLDYAKEVQFAGVGQLVLKKSSSTGYGTATYIGKGNGKHWILTAEHVLSGYITDGSVFKVGGKDYKLGGTYSYLGDLAVIPISGTGVDDLTATAYLNHALPIDADPAKRWEAATVGYGLSGTGSKPLTVDDSKKRAMRSVIDAYKLKTYTAKGDVNQEFDGYMADFDNGAAAKNTLDSQDVPASKLHPDQRSARTQLDLEGGVASGDSGGPLMTQRYGKWVIAGVTSGKYDAAGFGQWDNYIAADAEYGNFIAKKTGIKPLPEPATLTLVALGAAFLARRRLKN
jgi:hypothetical protein